MQENRINGLKAAAVFLNSGHPLVREVVYRKGAYRYWVVATAFPYMYSYGGAAEYHKVVWNTTLDFMCTCESLMPTMFAKVDFDNKAFEDMVQWKVVEAYGLIART